MSWKPLQAPAAEPHGLEKRRAERDFALVVDLLDRAIDHQRDEIGLVRFADAARAHQRAVAQDRHAIAELEHFLEAMADVDDGHAVRLEAADQLEQGGGFLTREIRGRLVEDQKCGAAPLGARGRHQLLLADGERGEDYAGGQVEAEVIEQLLRLAQHRLVIEQAALRHFVAEENVGRHGQVRAEHHLLVDGVDAKADRLVRIDQRNRLAAPINFAGGPGIDAGQQLDQRRLAGAVFADDPVDFALLERQIHRLQRMSGAEALVELMQGEERRRGGGGGRRSLGRHGHLAIHPTDKALSFIIGDDAPPRKRAAAAGRRQTPRAFERFAAKESG
jgi:hypothetical protein